MPSRKSKKWQSRRKPSLGQLRRAHPASGATWNVQVVRGKMTSKCLWHACRALVLGMILMLLGAGMATVGYYADQLSVAHEIRGNATVRVKNESRGFHLNNLSYVGPIVMGFGGFIVVAACVMTFEARDSAAKVVPARFKLSNNSRTNIRSNSSSANSARRANGIMHQATRWDHHLGVFRTSPAEPQPVPPPMDRQALTAALVHFSKTLGNSPRQSPKERRFSHSGSVPNLTSLTSNHRASVSSAQLSSPNRRQLILGQNNNTLYNHHRHQQQQQQQQQQHHHHHHSNRHHHHHSHSQSGGSRHHENNSGRSLSKSRNVRISSSLVNRISRDSNSSLLHPSILQKLHRNSASVDETGPYFRTTCDSHGSLTSVILMDSHEGRIRDRTRRSDTAKKHIFTRQKPIEKEESHSPKLEERRRSSTASDNSFCSRYRRASTASRTPSIDSRSVQVEMHSPEINKKSPRTPRRYNSMQSSTPSVEREFRSQHSVCSEPSQVVRQSSLEPCVLEESPENEDIDNIIGGQKSILKNSNYQNVQQQKQKLKTIKKPRPETLSLDYTQHDNIKLQLQRSNSSRTHNRPKPKPIYEYDTNIKFQSVFDDDGYDSVQVINERRGKLLKTESESALQKSRLHLKDENSIENSFINLTKVSNKDSTKMDVDGLSGKSVDCSRKLETLTGDTSTNLKKLTETTDEQQNHWNENIKKKNCVVEDINVDAVNVNENIEKNVPMETSIEIENDDNAAIVVAGEKDIL